MSTTASEPQYVLGEAAPQQDTCARFETKGGHGSGAGYERWRSYEFRPHTPRRGKEDVYVPHHRLLAVVACYPPDMPIEDILADLDGKDVHHSSPEVEGDRGVKWDNRPSCLHVIDHAEHSSITNAQVRAWAEDDKARRDSPDPEPDADACVVCGATEEPFGRSPDWDGLRCLPCAKEASEGAPIEVV
ncbi:hypothetical protein [Halorarum salinum]|uniref:Uncharacterized protein n=1 Tax=Halorarum salinum TaxID=2743089 RepID=A0A7D5QHM4_9EURY|nr:hypothetical protein [Halobaculum salinum]QLG62862.1 hypothetical protein HUG12_14445 [Halobaculum salinum]